MAESLACVDHSAFGCGYCRIGFRALGLRVWGRICSMRPPCRGVMETRKQQFAGLLQRLQISAFRASSEGPQP